MLFQFPQRIADSSHLYDSAVRRVRELFSGGPGVRMSLSMRLTLLALATLIPISALTVFSYIDEQRRRRSDEITASRDYTESVAGSIDNFARDLESLTLSAALSIGSQPQEITQANTKPFLTALARENPILRAIFVTDPQGRVVAQDRGDDTGRDLSTRPYVRQLMAGEQRVWSAGLEGVESGQITVAMGRVIRDDQGGVRGFLIAAFYPALLSERLPTPERGNIVLIDQEGQLLFSSQNPQLVLEKVSLAGDRAVQAALAGTSVELSGDETAFDEGQRFGRIMPLPTLGWALGYTRSQARLDASVRDALLRDLGILVIIGTASVAAMLLVARQVSRPLGRLAEAVGAMHEPNWSLASTAEPDIARLQDAFLKMRDEVATRERRLEDQAMVLDTLERAGHALASELDFDATVQAVTDAGVRATEASYGALFYNVVEPSGESYQLYTLSGAERDTFDAIGMPRNTELFAQTFNGEGPVRLDDVTLDARYGKNAPFSGMPDGHLPVRSYLAVPVVSRSGAVLGGLFFGHEQPGMFSERHEKLAVGIASWASIALDNARMYEAAQERQQELIKANAAKDEFLGLVSHELRTPITIIMGAAKHLQDQAARLDDETREQLLNDVRDNAGRLSQLVHNILVLARNDRLDGEQAEPVLVRPPIEATCDQFESRNPTRTLVRDLGEAPAIVLGSRIYLEQIVANLLSNADKYSPEGEPIELSVRAEGGTLTIAVRDHGPGLSDEDLERVFEPYYRGAEARRRAAGFGLGLPVCRRLAEAMGGQLSLANHPGGGAEFIVTLPLYIEPLNEDAPTTATPPEPVAV